MAAHKGVGLRTPRTRALEIGTTSKGFEGGMPYDPQLGVPQMPGMPAGEYKDAADAAHPTRDGGIPSKPAPFTVK